VLDLMDEVICLLKQGLLLCVNGLPTSGNKKLHPIVWTSKILLAWTDSFPCRQVFTDRAIRSDVWT
jgi:hypothetical protein